MKKTILLFGVLLLTVFLSKELLANYSDNFDKYHSKTDRGIYAFLPCLSLLNYDVTFHVTSNGNDLEGALVTVGPLTLPTNASGIAVFSLENGDYNYTVTKNGFTDAEGTFTIAGEPLLVEVEMEPCWNLVLHLIDQNGTITDSALVIVNNDSLWTTTGTATFCVTELTINYEVYIEGYYPSIGTMTIPPYPVIIQIIMNPVYYGVTFFVNCCGEPLAGISLTIGTQTIVTGPTGMVILSLPAGTYSYIAGGIEGTVTIPPPAYIDLDICGEVTFHVTNEQGYPLENVLIDVDGSYLYTDFNGETDTYLQVGSYNYSASKPGFVTQTGTFEMDTIPQTVEIVMPAETWGLTFQVTGLDCENEFEGLIIIIYGDTLLPGETINLVNGTYYYNLVLIGCGILFDGMTTINNASVTNYIDMPGLSQVKFHVTDQWLSNFEGAAVNVEDDILYTDYSGEASFCMTGGYHDYWVANPGYDTIPNYFVFPCQDTTIEVMLMTGSIRKEKMTQLDIYPNPSSGKFYLEAPNFSSDPIEFQVMDLTGRIVYERKQALPETIEIDLSNQPKGMYFLRIKTEEENYTQKLIIQ